MKMPARGLAISTAARAESVGALHTSWDRMWSGLGATGNGWAQRDELLRRYSEPWRRYHTVQHLSECLALFTKSASQALRPAEVEAGLWFHDAVYELRANDNEARSAQLALSVLDAGHVRAEVAHRVSSLVLATRHSALPGEADEQMLVDIDLSILGAVPLRFAEYEQQIRDEYSFVPDDVFMQKRREILNAFLARHRIFSTEQFHARFEQPARANLARATGIDTARDMGRTPGLA
jgi:predicted metal-dependent HD superfamily phosphohydrolase